MKNIFCSQGNLPVYGVIGLFLMLPACTTAIIDEVRHDYIDVADGEKIVIVGRHHKSEYETEVDFVECVGDGIFRQSGIQVVPEQVFVDSLYPWFEPRTAPLRLKGMENLLQKTDIETQLSAMGVRHIIWIDGSTEVTSKAGSMACGASLTGASCIGFVTWDSEAVYVASIWDYKNRSAVGKVSAEAKGTSYMPAIMVPIPLVARVKTTACQGLSGQLKTFLTSTEDDQ